MTLAFVFPGQGSQAVGMQAKLAAEYPHIEQTYTEASEVLGIDLWDLVHNGPAEKLNETVNTQPAMLTAGVAAWRAWQSAAGPLPSLMAGHSLGEYTAMVCAGALQFADAVRLVHRRAELMQAAVNPGEGAMAAILGLDDDVVVEICASVSAEGVADAVNFNSPGQVVVAGHKTAIERVAELAKESGARRAIILPVSVPAHSALMRPAGDTLAADLDATNFSAPQLQVICAFDAAAYGDESDIRRRLAKQTYSPVRWVDVVQTLIEQGASTIIECGPGKVLTGLIKRIDRGVTGACIDSPEALHNSLKGAAA